MGIRVTVSQSNSLGTQCFRSDVDHHQQWNKKRESKGRWTGKKSMLHPSQPFPMNSCLAYRQFSSDPIKGWRILMRMKSLSGISKQVIEEEKLSKGPAKVRLRDNGTRQDKRLLHLFHYNRNQEERRKTSIRLDIKKGWDNLCHTIKDTGRCTHRNQWLGKRQRKTKKKTREANQETGQRNREEWGEQWSHEEQVNFPDYFTPETFRCSSTFNSSPSSLSWIKNE